MCRNELTFHQYSLLVFSNLGTPDTYMGNETSDTNFVVRLRYEFLGKSCSINKIKEFCYICKALVISHGVR